MLRRLRIRTRLITLVVIPLSALLLVMALLMSRLTAVHDDLDDLYEYRVQPLKTLKIISDHYGIQIVDLFHKYRGHLLTPEQLETRMKEEQKLALAQWQIYLQSQHTQAELALIPPLEQRFEQVGQFISHELDLLHQRQLNQQDNDTFIHDLYQAFDPLTAQLNGLIDLQLAEVAETVAESDEHFAVLVKRLWLLGAILIVTLLGFSWLVYRSVSNPLRELGFSMRRIARDSDLTQQVDTSGNDEITRMSEALRDMLGDFRKVVGKLSESVYHASSAAEEMANISREVSTTVGAQEEKLNMVATAMTEMSGAVKEVAGNATATAGQASYADEQVRSGRKTVSDNLQAIETLSHSVDSATDVIRRLHGESGQISGVLTVIRNIAEQTNLLALNAAIESARAGEAGRGFAVVADEVRQLAQNTQKATASIAGMIDQLQASAQEAVSSMDVAGKRAADSVALAQAAGSLLDGIASAVTEIANMNAQVSTATEEQALVADDIHNNINEFTLSLGTVAGNARQSALASQQIAALAADLQQQISIFRV